MRFRMLEKRVWEAKKTAWGVRIVHWGSGEDERSAVREEGAEDGR